MAALHLRAAASRAEKKDNAMARATAAAETKIRMAMAAMQVASIEDGSAFDTRGFFVYGLWGKGEPETPLYVGLSTNILARLGAHLGDKYKRPYIKTVTLIRCGSYLRAVECENRLIDLYQPPWNTRGCEARGMGGYEKRPPEGGRRASEPVASGDRPTPPEGTGQPIESILP